MSTTQRAKPDFGPAINGSRAIASASTDALLTWVARTETVRFGSPGLPALPVPGEVTKVIHNVIYINC
jgi:hypothetical protein